MATLEKTYIYKVYEGSTYKGILENVRSDLTYQLLINSAGAQLNIELAEAFPDVGATTLSDSLVTETGDFIVDESGGNILTSLTYSFANIPITLGNRVIVTEISDANPSGTTAFDGIITSWEGDYTSNRVTLQVLGHGVRLDNYILNPATDINLQQDTYDSEVALAVADKGVIATFVSQTFNLATDEDLATISVYLRKLYSTGVAPMSLTLFEGTPIASGAFVASVVLQDLSVGTTPDLVDFTFATPVHITGGNNYYFVLGNNGSVTSSYTTPLVEYNSTSVYANGQMYTDYTSGTGLVWVATTADLAFRIITSDGSVDASFVNDDPSEIIRDALDIFNAQGQLVSYDEESIDDTGTTQNYTFLLATIMQTIKKAVDLAPSDWYWYVDPTTNLLHFHDSAVSAEHTFVLGRHLETLEISQKLDQVTNAVVFSGGDTGAGENLLLLSQDVNSVAVFGQWLNHISDKRVTLNDTATALSDSIINRGSTPIFNTSITIVEDTYDISTIRPGQMVQLRNFNNLIDSLLLQIVATVVYPDRIKLTLGTLLPRNGKYIDDIQHRLDDLEAENNPTSI